MNSQHGYAYDRLKRIRSQIDPSSPTWAALTLHMEQIRWSNLAGTRRAIKALEQPFKHLQLELPLE